ncbi:MAG: nucleotidyltransferase family protein [Acidimicrobiia bacterium]
MHAFREMDGSRPLDQLVSIVRNQMLDVPLAGLPVDLDEQLPMLSALARRHLVVPALHDALASALPTDHPAAIELENAHVMSIGNHLRILADLARLAPLLESTGARWAVLKGPVLAEVFYPRPDLRSYDDLDVLVEPGRLGDVVDALEASGAHLLDVNWPLIRSSGRGEITLVLWHGTVLDLHWDLITEQAVRSSFRLDASDLLDRRRQVGVASITVPTLGRGDTLTHVGLHALLAGGDRLGWLADLAAIMQRDGALTTLDWKRTEEQRCTLAVAIMLDRLERVLGDPNASASLATAPRTPAWRRLLARSDRVRPPESFPGRLSMRLLARSTRGSTRASVAAVFRSVWEEVGTPVLHRTNPWGKRPSVQDDVANPLWIANGTAVDRQECFREIAEASSRA